MASRPSRILAVDDNKQNLDLLTKALTSAKYEVITANDGLTALNLVESAAADLVLLDVMMPGMSGYEVCEKTSRERCESPPAGGDVDGAARCVPSDPRHRSRRR